jgi:Flp pilus assembly protein TadG
VRDRRPARASGDQGAALVEFALVFPVLAMLLLGMISGAVAWNTNLALSQGARVAARQAVTIPLPATTTEATMAPWLDGIAGRAVAASEGAMGSGVDGRAVCVAFVYPAGAAADQTFSRSLGPTGTRTSSTLPCFPDGQDDDARRVQVVLERKGVLDIGIRRQVLSLRRQVVYRYEAYGGI